MITFAYTKDKCIQLTVLYMSIITKTKNMMTEDEQEKEKIIVMR